MPAHSGLSACIITLNEADRIDACLDSLAFCDELIVVDSGSTDDTRERAAAHGARVLVRPFDGYRSQKAYAVGLAQHDWVLCLDADERVTPALRDEIEHERDNGFPTYAGYRFPRLTEYFGAFLRHGNAYPDRVLRLFDRRRGGWRGDREIHEHARTTRSGALARVVGRARIDDNDVVAECERVEARVDAIRLVESDDAGREAGACGHGRMLVEVSRLADSRAAITRHRGRWP